MENLTEKYNWVKSHIREAAPVWFHLPDHSVRGIYDPNAVVFDGDRLTAWLDKTPYDLGKIKPIYAFSLEDEDKIIVFPEPLFTQHVLEKYIWINRMLAHGPLIRLTPSGNPLVITGVRFTLDGGLEHSTMDGCLWPITWGNVYAQFKLGNYYPSYIDTEEGNYIIEAHFNGGEDER